MKAVVCNQYGSPEVLKINKVPKPTPKPNEVLVKVHASTVAVADVRIRSFDVPISFWIPARIALGLTKPKNSILGIELAGEVIAIGAKVTDFQPGDQVYGSNLKTFGAYAEYVCLPVDGPLAKKPTNLSYAEAAAMPIGARTALHFLNRAEVKPGQKVLIYGASGSVGTYAIQLAKYFGAEVTAVCSEANFDLVRSLGADKVIDYRASDFAQQFEAYDIFFEAVDKCPFSIAKNALKAKGTYLNITQPFPSFSRLWTSLTTGKKILMADNPPTSPEGLLFLKDLVERGALIPVIDREYPLEDIIEAHRYVDEGHKKGNVVVSIA
ncbi:NAD(P)-dependent alcohol dehydrogenase [marine bacterium AO1-C]|nr:NAD(P)-dependent alcohol dehydrogenase [marine bacterium AO1-C]